MPDGSRILFVDDEPNILDALECQFQLWEVPWDMTFTDNPETALHHCRTAHIDLAVLDMGMPGMSGIELAKAIHSVSPQTICIMLTGAADLRVAMEAVNDAGIFRFYTKPCDMEVLARGIREGLATAALRSGQHAEQAPNNIELAVARVTLERLPISVIVLDGHGKVIFTNASGGALLAERDGISLSSDGTCRAATPGETRALQDCVRAILTPDSHSANESGIALKRPSMRRPLSVLATPIDEGDVPGNSGARVALFVTDPERQMRPSRPLLQKLFQLTDSEAKIVQGLVQGKSLDEIAPESGITISSARTYLKQAFAKTGTNRQADLVRLVLSSPAVMKADGRNSAA